MYAQGRGEQVEIAVYGKETCKSRVLILLRLGKCGYGTRRRRLLTAISSLVSTQDPQR